MLLSTRLLFPAEEPLTVNIFTSKKTMLSLLVIATGLLSTAAFGEAVKCYHCYESTDLTLSSGSLDGTDTGPTFVRCDKNKLKWNTHSCPSEMPNCVVMSAKVQNHFEVVRSCAKTNFCSKYVPPPGVQLQQCRDCNTTLCNDYLDVIDDPVQPGPLFVFNVNINLKVKKLPLVGNETLN